MGFLKSLGKGIWQPIKLTGQAAATIGTAVAVGVTLGQARGPKRALRKVAKETGKTFMDSDIRHLGETIGLGVATAGTAVAVGVTLGQARGPKKATKKLAKKTAKSFGKTTVVGKAAVVAAAGFGLGAAAATATNAVNVASAAVSVPAAGASGAATAVIGMAADGAGASGKPSTPKYVPDPKAKKKHKQPKRTQEEHIARDPPPVKTKKPEEKKDSKTPLCDLLAAEIDQEIEDYQDKKTYSNEYETSRHHKELLGKLQNERTESGFERRYYNGPISDEKTADTPVQLTQYCMVEGIRCGVVIKDSDTYNGIKKGYDRGVYTHMGSVYVSVEDLLDDKNWSP